MSNAVVDISDPDVRTALGRPSNGTVWEVLRRLARPAAASDIAAITNLDPVESQRALDELVGAGLVERLPARADRRALTYRTLGESVLVTYDPDDATQLEAIVRISAGLRDHVLRAMVGNDPGAGTASRRRDRRIEDHRVVTLSDEEQSEVRRLLREVTDYLEAAQARITKASADQACAGNYCVSIAADATPAATPPVAGITFVPKAELDDHLRRSHSNGVHLLSPREREVGLMLAAGRSRPEIARELGVSHNTVATITKRIYAKLGVRRRAELSNRIRRAGA